MILYNNIVKISNYRWIGYMLKVAFLLASSILVGHCDLISRFSDFALYIDTQLVYFHFFFRL